VNRRKFIKYTAVSTLLTPLKVNALSIKVILYASIDKDACTSCDSCIEVCPTEAILSVDKRYSIHEDRCILCRDCVFICPVDAISLWGIKI